MTWHPLDLPAHLQLPAEAPPAPPVTFHDDPWQHDPDRATRRGF